MDWLTHCTGDTANELLEQVIDVEVISSLDKVMLGLRVTLAS